MAGAIVSSILEQITTIICQGVLEEGRLLIGIKGDLRNLRKTLTSIRALLEDAEEKQISNGPVKLWLDRLKEESFDMEDALDEWRTVLLTGGAENACFLWRTVPVFLRYFSFHPVRYHRIARNIKEINGRLHKIAEDITSTVMISRLPTQRESKSFIDEPSLLGRENVKNEIISWSIVGIGKTAVAQLVYHDENVKQHFTCRVWTYISNNFDERRVAKDINVDLQGLEKQTVLQSLESVPLDALLDEVRKSLGGMKYLLVLDDVWTEKDKDFEGLNATFKCGAPGSRILMTIRKNTVATIMESSHSIQLNNMSPGICWSIISKIALREKDQKTCEEFQSVGLKIAEKCSGLPLVAKTLGGLLLFKTGIQGWENVLNSELWRMEIIHKEVFVPLLLSYYDLSSPVRQYFTYFAFYNKRTRLLVCHMISVWMAQGYSGLDDDYSSLEKKGFEYLQCLMDRCFFQDFESKDISSDT